jgi:hypothetical protein
MYQKQIELNQFISVLSRLPIGEKTFVFGYSKAGDFALLVNSTKMGIIVECKSVVRVSDIEAFFSKKDKLFINNEIYPGRLVFVGHELEESLEDQKLQDTLKKQCKGILNLDLQLETVKPLTFR